MLAKFRLFLAVIEEGSLHKAAARLRISQSALSRQMQALEDESGGLLLERTSTGVVPTNGGHALAEKMSSLLAHYDDSVVEMRRLVRGEGKQMRFGCIGATVADYIRPALVVLRWRRA
jgi:DNA-binding transcriptional LysR family regulator